MKKLARHWQAPAVGLLGVWLAAAPWVLGWSGSQQVVIASLAIGLALVVGAAGMLHPTKAAGGAWLAVVAGVAAAASPWLLGYADNAGATTNAVAAGLVAAVLALWVAMLETDQDGWWNDRVAH